MSMYLPYGGFKWNEEEWCADDIIALDPKSDIGYTFEVDLSIPKELHDYMNGYIPCPENISIDPSNLNHWQREGYKESPITKLCTTFLPKKKYVVNYRYLQLCLSLGVQLDGIHRICEYKQKPFMKQYIDQNTESRRLSVTKFGKNFYKLMNNSVYGKCMENVKNRINFRLISTEEEAWRVKNLKHFTIFDDNLVGVHILKKVICLNKPVYIGQTVLDDSKQMMYDFHYNFMLKQFPRKDVDILMTDTDSLFYQIRNHEINDVFAKHKDLFDFGNYDKKHPLYDNKNDKVIGKMKNESPTSAIVEYCGLRSKMYAFNSIDNDFTQHCKGIKTSVCKENFTLESYKNTLFNHKNEKVKQCGIRSFGHELYTVEVTKIGLSYFDDKVFICDDNIHTYNFGQYKIGETLFKKNIELGDKYVNEINNILGNINDC